jgi:hypothetical protein
MTQGLDTGLSTKQPGFDSRLNHQVFQITTIYRRRYKAVGPGYYLVVVVTNDLSLSQKVYDYYYYLAVRQTRKMPGYY